MNGPVVSRQVLGGKRAPRMRPILHPDSPLPIKTDFLGIYTWTHSCAAAARASRGGNSAHRGGSARACGMRMGQVIGRSDHRGECVVERPLDPQDVAATVYHHLGIDARSIYFRDLLDRPMPLLDKGEAIREVVG